MQDLDIFLLQVSASFSILYSSVDLTYIFKIESLSTRVFETRTITGREYFACQGSGVSQIFLFVISNGEKILTGSDVNVVV